MMHYSFLTESFILELTLGVAYNKFEYNEYTATTNTIL